MATLKLKAFSANFKLFSLAALMALPVAGMSSGGDDVCDDMECNSFFAPEIINRPEESPFFRSWHTFYLYQDDASLEKHGDINAINIKEWKAYLEKSLSDAKVTALIYTLPLSEVELLQKALAGAVVTLTAPTAAIKSSLVTFGKREKLDEALKYVVFAKQVEPLATRRLNRDSWDASNVPADVAADLAEANRLIAVAAKNLQSLGKKDTFLSNRYRLQTIRLYYYSGQHAAAQNYYTANRKAFDQDDSAKFRFMESAAGAYYRDKKYGMANYLFSRIYDSFPPMKRAAYFSFHPMEQKDWEETLALAKNDREREVLWQLLGIYHDGLTAIAKIHAINPKSELLPLLLVREVNIAEENWSSNQDRIANGVDATTSGVTSDLEAVGAQRIAAIRTIADSGKVRNPYLWQLAVGHLYALSGDLALANQYLDLADDTVPNSLPNFKEAKAQIRISTFFTFLRGIKKADKANEAHLAKELSWLKTYASDKNFRARTLNLWALKRLSGFYFAKGDLIRGVLLQDDPKSKLYRDVAQIDAMLEFRSQTDLSAFDDFLVSNTAYDYTHLKELSALNYLFAGKFDEALKQFEEAPANVSSKVLNADPFMIHINDCHDCDFMAPHTLYTEVTFTQRMRDLAKVASGTGAVAAQASFELANGFYNMSYYGNSRDIYDTDFGNLRPNLWGDASVAQEKVLNMDLAEKFYVQAMQKSVDKEFKAKAAFMAAKAEQNRYYYTHATEMNTGIDIHPGKYYHQLKSEFSDTLYYQEIIRECGYFRKYANGAN